MTQRRCNDPLASIQLLLANSSHRRLFQQRRSLAAIEGFLLNVSFELYSGRSSPGLW
jgi:hypothetical protein